MVLSSYSKINLSLLVNSKQKSGLHNIQSYFCLINLKDKIKIKKIDGKSDKINFIGPFSKLIIFFSICFDKEVSFTHPILPPILAVSDMLKMFAVAAKPIFLILFKISE